MHESWLDTNGDRLGPGFPLPIDRTFDVVEAREQGIPRHVLLQLESRGLLRRELRGVYVATQVPHDMRTRIDALTWVLTDDQVVCDRTAAWLHGVPILPRSARWRPPALDVCSVMDTTRARRAGLQGTRRRLASSDIEIIDGVATTTPLRTALDLGRMLPRLEAMAAVDGFRALGVPLADLQAETARFRGFRGVVQLRALLPISDPRSQSPGESALRLVWHDALLPWPEPQFQVPHDDGSYYLVDIADPGSRFGAEYDGVEHHTTTQDREHDERRRTWLRDQEAWAIEVFTKADVYPRHADPAGRLAAAYARHQRSSRHLWTPGWRPRAS